MFIITVHYFSCINKIIWFVSKFNIYIYVDYLIWVKSIFCTAYQLSIDLSIYLSKSLFISLSIYLSIKISIYLSIYQGRFMYEYDPSFVPHHLWCNNTIIMIITIHHSIAKSNPIECGGGGVKFRIWTLVPFLFIH